MTNSERYFGSKESEAAFNKGFESKSAEIKGMGWEAARDKFNIDLPPGVKTSISSLGLWFCKGEAEALSFYAPN